MLWILDEAVLARFFDLGVFVFVVVWGVGIPFCVLTSQLT